MQNPRSPAAAGSASYALKSALPVVVGLAAALMAAMLWGTGNVAQKFLLGSLTDIELLGSRGTLGFLTVLPFAILELVRQPQIVRQYCASWKPVALCTFGFFAAMSLQTLGATTASATVVGFLINLNVIFVPLLLMLHVGHMFCRFRLAACFTCLAGTALMSGGMQFNWSWGELFCILAALGFAYWMLGLTFIAKRINAPFCTTALLLLPFPLLLSVTAHWDVFGAALTNSNLQWPLLFIGVGSTGISFLFAAVAQKHLNPVLAAMTYSLEAVFGAATAFLVLGERMSTLSLVGAGILIGGIMTAQIIEACRIRPDSLPQRKMRRQNGVYSKA